MTILNDSQANGRKRAEWFAKNWQTALIALVVGSGGSVVSPRLLPPDWYASDRFTGTQANELRHDQIQMAQQLRADFDNAEVRVTADIKRLEAKVSQFMLLGPVLVTTNQEKMINSLEHMVELMRDMQSAQVQHFATTSAHRTIRNPGGDEE